MITSFFGIPHGKAIVETSGYSPERGMPPTDDHLFVRIKINRLIGRTSNITVHRDLSSSYWEVGNWSGCANIDPYLTYITQQGQLSAPSPVFCVKIRRMTIGTSVNNLNPLCKILHLLETTNRSKDFLLEDLHFRFSFQNRWTDKVTSRIFLTFRIPSIKDQFCPVFDGLLHIFHHFIQRGLRDHRSQSYSFIHAITQNKFL